MRDFIGRAAALGLLCMLIPACGGNGGGGGNGNPPPAGDRPPAVTMTSPANGSSFPEGSPVLLEADASDPDGTVAQVEFFDAATSLGTLTTAPYRLTWNASASGNHSLRAVATDDLGAMTSSSAVVVSVTATPPQPVTPTGWLRSVFFADVSHGWIVAEGGRIYMSTDGGTTWFAQASGTTADLERVQFVSASRGWIVGAGGTILSTSNGGATWSSLSSGTTAELQGLSFVSATHGWVGGGEDVVLRTIDGGGTWARQDSGLFRAVAAASFVSATTGWVAGADQVASTTDGGSTWHLQEISYPGPGYSVLVSVLDIRFMSATAGTLVGTSIRGDVIMTTRDGGATWSLKQQFGITASDWLAAVAFGDAAHWWTVGSFGRIAASSDGGLTWNLQTSPTTLGLYGVWFVNANVGWTVGANGTVLRTTNGGATWTLISGGS